MSEWTQKLSRRIWGCLSFALNINREKNWEDEGLAHKKTRQNELRLLVEEVETPCKGEMI